MSYAAPTPMGGRPGTRHRTLKLTALLAVFFLLCGSIIWLVTKTFKHHDKHQDEHHTKRQFEHDGISSPLTAFLDSRDNVYPSDIKIETPTWSATAQDRTGQPTTSSDVSVATQEQPNSSAGRLDVSPTYSSTLLGSPPVWDSAGQTTSDSMASTFGALPSSQFVTVVTQIPTLSSSVIANAPEQPFSSNVPATGQWSQVMSTPVDTLVSLVPTPTEPSAAPTVAQTSSWAPAESVGQPENHISSVVQQTTGSTNNQAGGPVDGTGSQLKEPLCAVIEIVDGISKQVVMPCASATAGYGGPNGVTSVSVPSAADTIQPSVASQATAPPALTEPPTLPSSQITSWTPGSQTADSEGSETPYGSGTGGQEQTSSTGQQSSPENDSSSQGTQPQDTGNQSQPQGSSSSQTASPDDVSYSNGGEGQVSGDGSSSSSSSNGQGSTPESGSSQGDGAQSANEGTPSSSDPSDNEPSTSSGTSSNDIPAPLGCPVLEPPPCPSCPSCDNSNGEGPASAQPFSPCPGRGYECADCPGGWFCPPQETPAQPAPCGSGWPCYHCSSGWFCEVDTGQNPAQVPQSTQPPVMESVPPSTVYSTTTVTVVSISLATEYSIQTQTATVVSEHLATVYATTTATFANPNPPTVYSTTTATVVAANPNLPGGSNTGGSSGSSGSSDGSNSGNQGGSGGGSWPSGSSNSGSGGSSGGSSVPLNSGSSSGGNTGGSSSQSTSSSSGGPGGDASGGSEAPSYPSSSGVGSGNLDPSWSSLGCFQDGISRVLVGGRPTDYFDGDVSDKTCVSHCNANGYNFAGTENGQECWCGTGIRDDAIRLPQTYCEMPCQGTGGELCGGSWTISVFVHEGGNADNGPPPLSPYGSTGRIMARGSRTDVSGIGQMWQRKRHGLEPVKPHA